MKKYKVEARFIKPYLQARFSEDAQASLKSKTGTKAKVDDEDMWKNFLYKDKKGIYIPSIQIGEALTGAGKGIKKKPYGNFKEIVQSYFMVVPDKIYLSRQEPDFLKTSYPKRADGQRVKLVHPGIEADTKFQFTVHITNNELDDGTIKEIIIKAGLEKGIGAWRAGGHGRFEVVKFKKG